VLAESVSADCRVSHVVRQRVPHQRASHGESPPNKCTPPLLRHVQQSPTSRSEMTPCRDVGDCRPNNARKLVDNLKHVLSLTISHQVHTLATHIRSARIFSYTFIAEYEFIERSNIWASFGQEGSSNHSLIHLYTQCPGKRWRIRPRYVIWTQSEPHTVALLYRQQITMALWL